MPVVKYLIRIGELELKIKKLTESQFPRLPVEPFAKVDYSVPGSSVGDGPVFASKHIWAINAYLFEHERDVLLAVYAEFDHLRRHQQPAQILLSDYTLPIVERAPRTKALAPGTEQTSMTTLLTKYFATFATWMVQPPQFTDAGKYVVASFTLQEV